MSTNTYVQVARFAFVATGFGLAALSFSAGNAQAISNHCLIHTGGKTIDTCHCTVALTRLPGVAYVVTQVVSSACEWSVAGGGAFPPTPQTPKHHCTWEKQ